MSPPGRCLRMSPDHRAGRADFWPGTWARKTACVVWVVERAEGCGTVRGWFGLLADPTGAKRQAERSMNSESTTGLAPIPRESSPDSTFSIRPRFHLRSGQPSTRDDSHFNGKHISNRKPRQAAFGVHAGSRIESPAAHARLAQIKGQTVVQIKVDKAAVNRLATGDHANLPPQMLAPVAPGRVQA